LVARHEGMHESLAQRGAIEADSAMIDPKSVAAE
jgi:hypothetical protein